MGTVKGGKPKGRIPAAAEKGRPKRGGKTRGSGPTEPRAAGTADTRVREPEPPDEFAPAYFGEPKFSAAVAKKIVDIVQRGNFRDTAAASVGISGRTLRKWLHAAANGNAKYQPFAAELDRAESEAEDLLVDAVTKQAKKDWRAAAWLLERRGSKRWGYKAQVEITIDEALEEILDLAASVLGGESAAKLFTALASRGDRSGEARFIPGQAGGGGSGAAGGSREGGPIH
jgi:hypothetical protein